MGKNGGKVLGPIFFPVDMSYSGLGINWLKRV